MWNARWVFRFGATIAVTAVAVAALAQPFLRGQSVEAASHAVSMRDNFFAPSSISIAAGDTITWTNDGALAHTATNGVRGSAGAGDSWDHVVASAASSPSVMFNTPGTVQYFCRFHFGMDGTITVQVPSTPTPAPTTAPTPPPPVATKATPTPFPELTVVPADEITPPAENGGNVVVVQPTSPLRFDLTEVGVGVQMPARARQRTLQLRVQSDSSESVQVQPEGEVLRLVRIDLFDVDGQPLSDTQLWFPAKLSITLSEREVGELGGTGALLNGLATGRLGFRRLSTAGIWSDLHTSLDIATRTFSASISRFSVFALTWAGRSSGTAPTTTPVAASAGTTAAPDVGDTNASVVVLLSLGSAITLAGGLISITRRRG